MADYYGASSSTSATSFSVASSSSQQFEHPLQPVDAHLLRPSNATNDGSSISTNATRPSQSPRHASTSRVRTLSTGADMRRSSTTALKRSRAESVTRDDDPLIVAGQSESLQRGPGTPDFTLDRFASIRGKRSDQQSRHVSSPMRNVVDYQRVGLEGGADDEDDEQTKKRAGPIADASTARPRLTTRIRSFLTSFSDASPTISLPDAATAKARTSLDSVAPGQLGGASAADKFQNLAASAQSLANDTRSMPRRPQPLVMPAARPAAFDGLRGLNDDSPPLTPATSDERGSDKEGEAQYPTRTDLWSPFSSSDSGRTSPISLTSFSLSRLLPSASSSSARTTTSNGGLLPSHMLSPPSSPEPHGRACSSSSRRAAQLDSQQHWTSSNVAQSLSTASSAMVAQLQTFFFAAKMPPLRPHIPALFFLMTAFVGSTLCILLALSTLPLRLPSHITDLTLTEIRDLSLSLRAYSRSSPRAFLHTLTVLGAFFTWKQAFTVPGSIIMNVVFGAMYGMWMGTLYTSLMTAFGGMLCYLLMAPLGPLISAMPGLSKGLQKMRTALRGSLDSTTTVHAPIAVRSTGQSGHGAALHPNRYRAQPHSARNVTPTRQTSRSRKASARQAQNGKKSSANLWSYLLVLRLLPVVPYGLMNIACSVLRVPLLPYTVTLGLGSIPWNACTVQIGDLLVEVVSALPAVVDDAASPAIGGVLAQSSDAIKTKAQSGLRAITEKVWNREMMFKLALMSIVSLAPMLVQRYLKRRDTAAAAAAATEEDEGEEEELIGEEEEEEDEEDVADDEDGMDFTLDPSHSTTRAALDHGDQGSIPSRSLLDMRVWRSSWCSSSSGTNDRQPSGSLLDGFASKRTSVPPSFMEHKRTPSVKRAVAHTIV